jgi:hypothetical protein
VVAEMKPGDLVMIDPMWFGYDNILPQWTDSLFIIIDVFKEKNRIVDYKRMICKVLTPECTLCEFYDYELVLAETENYRKNVLL